MTTARKPASRSPTHLEPIRSGPRRPTSTHTAPSPRKSSNASSTTTTTMSEKSSTSHKKPKGWAEKALGAIAYLLCFCCVLGGEKPSPQQQQRGRVPTARPAYAHVERSAYGPRPGQGQGKSAYAPVERRRR